MSHGVSYELHKSPIVWFFGRCVTVNEQGRAMGTWTCQEYQSIYDSNWQITMFPDLWKCALLLDWNQGVSERTTVAVHITCNHHTVLVMDMSCGAILTHLGCFWFLSWVLGVTTDDWREWARKGRAGPRPPGWAGRVLCAWHQGGAAATYRSVALMIVL